MGFDGVSGMAKTMARRLIPRSIIGHLACIAETLDLWSYSQAVKLLNHLTIQPIDYLTIQLIVSRASKVRWA